MNDEELPRAGTVTAANGEVADREAANGEVADREVADREVADGELAELSLRLGAVEQQLAEFHRRAAHRESVIDRLHEENQQLKQGGHRAVLEPVVADLIRLHDQLSREARRAGAEGGLIGSFSEEVAEILDRCGIEVFTAQPGESFQGDRHRPLAVVPTSDPELHNTVAEAVAAGFYDRENDRVRRPAQARFHQYLADGES